MTGFFRFSKQNDFDDINIIGKLLYLAEEQIESLTIRNEAKFLVYNKNLKVSKKSIFHDLERFLRTTQKENEDN